MIFIGIAFLIISLGNMDSLKKNNLKLTPTRTGVCLLDTFVYFFTYLIGVERIGIVLITLAMMVVKYWILRRFQM